MIFLLSSCILGLFFMEEVHPKYRNQVDIRWTLTGRIQNIFRGKGWKTDEGIYTLRADETDVEASQSPESATEAHEYPEAEPPSAFIRQLKLQILSISIQGFLKISTLVIVPIFLATPSDPNQSQNLPGDSEIVKGILGIKGGFGLDTISTSNILLSQAAVVVIAQARLIPAIIDKYRPLQSFRAAIVVLLYLYCLLPFTANLAPRIGMPSMLLILCVQAVASSLATISSSTLYVCSLKFEITLTYLHTDLQTRHPHPSTWQPSMGQLLRLDASHEL